jgi:hypothetical protein
MHALAHDEHQDLAFGYTQHEESQVDLARNYVEAFISYVLRDEETGRPILCQPFQMEWHRLAERYDRLILWAYMESGKSVHLSIGRTLWELGRDPTLRVAIVSGNEKKAVKIAGTIAAYIRNSEELHRVFPHLEPDPNKPWNTEQFTVRRNTYSKDPSVQVVGTGSDIQGARLDRAILDDILNHGNTRTKYMREQTNDWYLKTIPGRMTARGRIVGIGNAFHPDDQYHRLAKNSRFHAFKYPIVRADGTPMWPGAWSPERIEARKAELGPLESMSQLMCQPIDDALARFKREYMDICMSRGEGKDIAYALREIPPGCKVYCGVDLAVGLKKSNDLTVFFLILVHPNGDREVLWVESGRLLAAEIMAKVVDINSRFHPVFVIENVAAQQYLVDLLQGSTAIPILPFTTGKNKVDPTFGVEAMSAQFAAGKWIIPNHGHICHPEVQAWMDDMLGYSPLAHTGDRLMASWIANEGERLGQTKPPPVTGIFKLKLGF